MQPDHGFTLALFFCRRTAGGDLAGRTVLEGRYGPRLRLFPLPCAGRLDGLHLLRALETFADAAYVVCCPENTCRYLEGNLRARKRVERAQHLLAGIGLEPARVGLVPRRAGQTLDQLVARIWDTVERLGPSPVHRGAPAARPARGPLGTAFPAVAASTGRGPESGTFPGRSQ